ncbi:MAG: DUF1080 domain-containing protein [Kiritimatiellae bacterium]|nr:DUF1080 domain-containing protein [Kiritimatiellia bacterium]
MNIKGLLIFVAAAGMAAHLFAECGPACRMSDGEKNEGFVQIFDGTSSTGWRSRAKPTFPEHGWEIKEGVLTVLPKAQGGGGGDIITEKVYSNFIFKMDFQLTPKANSGLKYLFDPKLYGGTTMEYQVLDSAHPDAKAGIDGNRRIASLYDVLPASEAEKILNPTGEWNQAMLVVKGMHVEHWLNGQKVLEFERGSDEFNAAVAKSKFNKHQGWGTQTSGHLLLQDHNDKVSYRNLRIKEL